MRAFLQDLRYGLRMLVKNPGFTAVAVLTLALGIAANTTIFSMVSGVLLRRPPVRDPHNAVMVVSANAAKGWNLNTVSVPDFVTWREQNHAFEEMAASEFAGLNLTGEAEPEHLTGMRVSAGYFRVLGVPAALGRTFLPGEDQAGRDHVVVLSHGLWEGRFGSDPKVIGKSIKLSDDNLTVIGVMPARFRLLEFDAQVWTPIVFTPERLGPTARGNRSLNIVARLRPGVTVESAQAEMVAIAHRIEQSYPSSKGWSARVLRLQRYIIEDSNVESAMLLLMAAVVFVLLIGCANLANLLLARSAARQKEFAVRAALGAGRFRLVRQMLVESLLVALAGGALGLVVASWGVDLLRRALYFNPYVRSMAREIVIDKDILAFTFGVSVLTVVLFGLAPALSGSAVDLNVTLKEGGRTTSGGSLRTRARSALVAGEIALALVLLMGAGLITKSFLEEVQASFGIDQNRVLTASVALSGTRYADPSKQITFFEDVLRHLETIPGAISVGATTILPPNENGRLVSFSIEGQPALKRGERPRTRYFAISPGYIRTMRIPVIRGREFATSDNALTHAVALANQAFVRRFFPNEESIGKRIRIDTSRSERPDWSEIVGIVGNVKDFYGEKDASPQVYECYLQRPSTTMTLVVRTGSDPAPLAPMLRRAVWDVDKDQPITDLRSMTKAIDDWVGGERLMSILMGIFAALALALATVGIYGVIAYTVAQQTHEIGIRMALGAQRTDVLRMVVGKGMLLAALGTAIGLAAALPLPRLLDAAFHGFKMHASPVFVCVPILVWIAALLGCYIPARRATKVDPMVALRYE